MSERWTTAEMPSQAGKRYWITGANSGIGYAAAAELVRHGAEVVIACRDRPRGEAALQRLQAETGGKGAGRAELVELDLASLDSVRRVAEAELARGTRLHGLINNAGVYAPKRRLETKDGFELQFGTNVLGHFALTCRLMPALVRASAAPAEDAPRVVTIASIAHKGGRLNFEDLLSQRAYSPMRSYAQSKLADLMFAFALDRRLRGNSLGPVSVAAHPGVARTNLFLAGGGLELMMRKTVGWVIGIALNSEVEGALPTLYAATAAEVEGGGYYGPTGFQEMRGVEVGPAKVAKQARDLEAQRRLWEVCEELTGCSI